MSSTPPPPPSAPAPPPRPAGGTASDPLLASWGSRVGAWLIDSLVVAIPAIIGVVGAGGLGVAEVGDFSGGSAVLLLVGYLASIVAAAWNLGWRQGTTGQSIGKGLLDIEVVDADDGLPIGFGLGIARWLVAGFLGALCLLDYLWPLWDDRNRAWHDMILNTSVIRTT